MQRRIARFYQILNTDTSQSQYFTKPANFHLSGYCVNQDLADCFRFAVRARSDAAHRSERNGDLSPSVASAGRISSVTKERWAQLGITLQFLIVVRTLGEVFRLRHALGASFSVAVSTPYVGGALIAVCFCWAAVTLYFFRRYILSVWIALAAIVILLGYKIAVIGR